MELLANLGLGFETALSPWNLLYAFVGCLLGTAVGVLPGLGPVATIAMLLPLTFSLPPVSCNSLWRRRLQTRRRIFI